jgi:hypothetical protein
MQGHGPEFLFPLEAVLSVDDVDLREVLPVRRFDRIMQDAVPAAVTSKRDVPGPEAKLPGGASTIGCVRHETADAD